jgi:hypothetical protein
LICGLAPAAKEYSRLVAAKKVVVTLRRDVLIITAERDDDIEIEELILDRDLSL